MFKVGVGQAEDIDTLKATRAAIARSRIHLGGIQPQAGIILCSSNVDHRQMLVNYLDPLLLEYEENSVAGVGGGQIIAIGTDGIWEARNKHGEMFGKTRFRDAIRRLADMKVEEIIEAIFEELKEFTIGVQPEDDVTLVVMRIKDEGI